MEKEILELFNVMVISKTARVTEMNTDHVNFGFVLDFTPTTSQVRSLKTCFKPLAITTLFSREERDNADPIDLIIKQFMHYVEVYGLETPGLFNLEVTSGKIITMNFVSGVTLIELGEKVRTLIYANAPLKDAVVVANIIKHYHIDYDINLVANNELRITMFDVMKDTFTSGDDAVRYMCYNATESAMLIKSKEVIDAVKTSLVPFTFLERHEDVLAQVFNRHKKIIMATKKMGQNAPVVNRISRKSKTMHVPIVEAINKTFIAKALGDAKFDMSVLSKISVRDKFKYLNLLAYKYEQLDTDAFIIRNGKMHIKTNRPVWDKGNIGRVEQAVLDSLKTDLKGLVGKKILLDKAVSYGLPVSRKQTVGNLPFGTRVTVDSDRISSGMYWENSWGATDLDLSTINRAGERTGWGGFNGYDNANKITYSGDITHAERGAFEFMTSKDADYGLFVNIYSGDQGSEMELVVGNDGGTKKWVGEPIIREKYKLQSRENIIGFVQGNEFVVFTGRLGNSRVSSSGVHPVVGRGMGKFWTVNDLFDKIGIDYDLDKDAAIAYVYELEYNGFSFDKLEGMLLP